jgi:hypothetical protein
MKNRVYLSFCMGLGLLSQPAQSISYEEAAVATAITTLGITGASYALFKHVYSDVKKRDKKELERWLCTAALAAPVSYVASVLWFGLTPEMRYVFASDTAGKNRTKEYAIRRYDEVGQLIEDYTSDYLDRAWLVDLHKDLVQDLQRTNRALRGWDNAQLEEGVEKFSQISPSNYKELAEQRACLEHNLFLLRNYKPFQQQQAAWISHDRHHCWGHCH